MKSLSRRSFLVTTGVTAPLGLALAACGGGSGGDSGDSLVDGTVVLGTDDIDGDLPPTFAVVQRWFPVWLVIGEQRLAVSLADAEGILPAGPETLTAQVLATDTGEVVARGIVGTRRSVGAGIPPYWTFTTNIAEPGFYALVVEGGDTDGAALQVLTDAEVTIAKPGDALAGFDTPTTSDNRGVDPICTLLPDPCPFHDMTLSEALASGKPVAFLVGTPAHCQTGTCAPALDALVGLKDAYAGKVAMVHAEIYTDDTATVTTPLVQFMGMDFEPTLFVTDATGVVTARLDAVFNADEIREALDAVV